jgi:hypothetical protein
MWAHKVVLWPTLTHTFAPDFAPSQQLVYFFSVQAVTQAVDFVEPEAYTVLPVIIKQSITGHWFKW